MFCTAVYLPRLPRHDLYTRKVIRQSRRCFHFKGTAILQFT
jgi:hypothetical protein